MNGLVRVIGMLAIAGMPLSAGSGLLFQGPAASGDVKVVDSVVYEAIQSRNATSLGQVLDDDFLLTNTFGAVYDKKQFLEACCSGDATSKTQYLGATDAQIKKYDNTAVIVARTELRFTRDNQDQKLAWRSTRVYVKSNGRWKLVAEQRTTLS